MNKSTQILSDITVFMKYAKYIPELQRRETWTELVDRNKAMHIKKYPQLAEDIEEAYKYVYDKKILPSMRSMQFAGKPIEINPARIYNCFRRDTEFITSEGVRSFADFADGDELQVLTHKGRWMPAVVRNYGKQYLNKITIKRGNGLEQVVHATGNHRWILQSGEETTNLREGDVLAAMQSSFNEFDYDASDPIERLYWAYGYIFGDGHLYKDGSDTYRYSGVRLCGAEKEKFLYRFEELGMKTSSSNSLNGDVMVYSGHYLKTAPDASVDSPNLITAFVRGYLDADGEKLHDSTMNSQFKSIHAADANHQEVIEKLFPVAGVIITSTRDVGGKKTNLGQYRKGSKHYNINTNIKNTQNTRFRVQDIEESVSFEDVWCLEVEEDRSFTLASGVVTGNCAYLPIDDWRAFGEAMFLLLGGTGVGYSVQKHHIEKLSEIRLPNQNRKKRYLVNDSIEGWADAVKMLVKSYFTGGPTVNFDFSDIRPKGARLVTSGGKAPGPQPLKECLIKLDGILSQKQNGDKLSSIEVHDMVCHIADAVLAGGIRRAALISLFSADDDEMIACKSGNWWETNAQRGRANNSAVLLRHKITEQFFFDLWKRIELSGAGEPGIYLTNDKDWGTNPCCEIALRPFQFCNLCEVNVSDIESQEDLNARVKAAAFVGTLQAGYTDFHYLRDIWRRTTEKDALIGVSMTGIGSGTVLGYDMKEAAGVVKEENERVAQIIGINKSARTTTVKPAGTTSLTLGTSSGIHAWHNDYYVRRIRVGKNEAIYSYLLENHPQLVEDEYFRPHDTAVISVPQKAPEGAILRTESAIELLERVKLVHKEWIKPGHRTGQNSHNVSATVSIKPEEWEEVGWWMWGNRKSYNGLSVLNYDGGSYTQAPFEDITEEQYEEMAAHLDNIDLSKVVELDDNTELKEQAACAGGVCEIR